MTGGESLHNNHHAWLVVRVLAAIRLVVIVDAPVSFSAGGAVR
jgi:predicted nuclease with RNAse H fold